MQNITITKIARKNTDKEGKTLKTKDGREYTRVMMQCNEYGDKWLSGFENYTNKNWQEGQTVDVTVEKVEKDGKEYLNFKAISSNEKLWIAIKELQARMTGLEVKLADNALPIENVDKANEEALLAAEENKEDIPW